MASSSWLEYLTPASSWFGEAPNTSDAATARGGDPLHPVMPATWAGLIGQNIGDIGRGIRQEGLGALRDPIGLVDRQHAQRQLSDRFQVVHDGFVGPRHHNQVTHGEYARIARTFSDIRLGRGDLTISGGNFSPFAPRDRMKWEAGMQSHLADMMMTTAGRKQVFNMSNNVIRDDAGNARRSAWGFGLERRGKTRIEPLFGSEGFLGELEEPSWLRRHAGTLYNANAAAYGNRGSYRDELGNRGEGGNARIAMNAGSISGLRSDVVLAHEMQHALHHTQGTNAPGTFGTGPDTDIANAERQAVGLTRSDTTTGGHYLGDPDGCTENT